MDDVHLTVKQRRFINHYLENGGNGVKAAEAAGYSGSYDTLRSVASENLAKPDVALHLRARADAEGATADRIVQRLALIAFMDLDSPYLKKTEYDRNGNVKSETTDLTQVVKAASELAKIRGLTRQDVDPNNGAPVRALIYVAPQGFELTAKVGEHASLPDDVADGEYTAERVD